MGLSEDDKVDGKFCSILCCLRDRWSFTARCQGLRSSFVELRYVSPGLGMLFYCDSFESYNLGQMGVAWRTAILHDLAVYSRWLRLCMDYHVPILWVLTAPPRCPFTNCKSAVSPHVCSRQRVLLRYTLRRGREQIRFHFADYANTTGMS